MQEKEKNRKKVLTPKFRVSFPSVFKARAFEGSEPKFSVTMLFPKNTDLKEMKAAAFAAAQEKWGADKNKWPKGLKLPFRDGDEKLEVKGYKGTWFVRASTKMKPGLVDTNRDDIIDEGEFYAGCYARAQIVAFAYDKAGNRGVSFSLENLQKMGDGERLGGREDAKNVFDEIESTEDDPSSYGNSESEDNEF